jgi:hypothetical protein
MNYWWTWSGSNRLPLPCHRVDIKQFNNLQDPGGSLSPCKRVHPPEPAYCKAYRVSSSSPAQLEPSELTMGSWPSLRCVGGVRGEDRPVRIIPARGIIPALAVVRSEPLDSEKQSRRRLAGTHPDSMLQATDSTSDKLRRYSHSHFAMDAGRRCWTSRRAEIPPGRRQPLLLPSR